MIVILISNASKKQIKSERFDQKSKITQMKIKLIKLFIILVFVNPISGKDWIISPNNNAQEEIQEALILAEPGDQVLLSKGIYTLDHGLSLDVDNVSIIGAGMYETILDFSNQETGAQGLLGPQIMFSCKTLQLKMQKEMRLNLKE